jgi:hypothetical protein
METPKVNELRKEIKYLEAEKAFNISMIGLLMAEANAIDRQIMDYTSSGLYISEKIRDLKAELKDTE